MSPPEWFQAIQTALRLNPDYTARFLQLSTIRTTTSGLSKPCNRTVTFRGFLDTHSLGPNLIKISTDARSEKIAQLQVNPWSELCWYFVVSYS